MVAHGGSTVFTLSFNAACVGQPYYRKLRRHKINANLVEYDFQKNEINGSPTKKQKLLGTKEVKVNR